MTRPIECPADCGSSDYPSRGWMVGCVECARRNPDLVAAAMRADAADMDELRRILAAAERWFLSIQFTETREESDLALALRARNPNLGARRGIQISHSPTT